MVNIRKFTIMPAERNNFLINSVHKPGDLCVYVLVQNVVVT